jgi:hypothetical protein
MPVTGPVTRPGSGGNTSVFFAHEPRDEPKKKHMIDISMHERTPSRYQRAFESELVPGNHRMTMTAASTAINPIVRIIASALITLGSALALVD